MKKKRILSLILCLSLFCTLIVPASSAYADQPGDSGMRYNKTATRNDDGSYTITLEAFATGSQQTTTQTKDVPTDIILVLDQSGSMDDPMGGYKYKEYKKKNYNNKDYFKLRHNGGDSNLWYKLSNDVYVAVSVEQEMVYTAISGWDNSDYYSNQDNLYCLVNGLYKKVKVERELGFFVFNYTYYVDGSKIGSGSGSSETPTFYDSYAPLYQSQIKYTYSYTLDGTTTKIVDSIGADTTPNTQFYKREYSSSAGGKRIDALKSAANAFIGAVAAKAAGDDNTIGTADDVKHRIAVVGFASKSGYGNNTELLSIAGSNSGSVGVAYNSIINQNLKDVLQPMDTQNGQNMVNAAIKALAANGATRTDLDMDMAERILNANPVPAGETRNRVVIVFTDGSPTNSTGFQMDVANAAINKADAIKNTYGATVYSIGIFSGADASTAGNPSGNEMQKANWFMQQVSSNNGTPNYPSYYLSAGDADSLNSIFQQISNNITTGGSSTTLGSETVIKDIISPYFTLPAAASASDIRLDTYDCTGMTGDTYTWSSTSGGNGGASAAVTGDQVSVTGFDFSENWCGTETGTNGSVTYRGKKLVITFTVDPKPGFLGGNGVPTNDNAGVYENGSATTPVITFEQPTVDVPIQDVTVTAEDKNVYLLSDVTAEQLKTGATVMVGDIPLDLSRAEQNYGLEEWQTAFVDITVTLKKADGTQIPTTGLNNLTDDTTYTIEVTVTPKESGSIQAQTGSGSANINVFKPELTFKDSEAYYGETVPADFSGNKFSETWKHGNTTSADTGVTMIGTMPTLNLSYTPEADKINNGKINTKQDIGVDVAVKIGNADVTNHTTFKHLDCAGQTCTLPDGMKFLIHVKTCTLNITKQGGAVNESYVFDVLKDGRKYSEVTIWGNGTEELVELPVGTYTIQENTGWNWRYTPAYGDGATLNATNPNGSITCTNTANDKIYWLNGFSQVVRNIFGVSH